MISTKNFGRVLGPYSNNLFNPLFFPPPSTGNNILFVGIYGPKGPCDEVFIKHTGRNQYQVNYLVRERGDYILLVKWGDDHIPGSPFKVEV